MRVDEGAREVVMEVVDDLSAERDAEIVCVGLQEGGCEKDAVVVEHAEGGWLRVEVGEFEGGALALATSVMAEEVLPSPPLLPVCV